jgi:hypothetical protein
MLFYSHTIITENQTNDALISKQAHLLPTSHAVNTVQLKVNGTDPYMAKVYLHMSDSTAVLIGYAAL